MKMTALSVLVFVLCCGLVYLVAGTIETPRAACGTVPGSVPWCVPQ